MDALKYTPFKTGETKINRTGNVSYITFKAYEKFPELLCAFSTREGGISKGIFSSMNLGCAESDSKENVVKNFEIFAQAIGTDAGNFVVSDQQHTDNIRIVSSADRGKGIYKEKDYKAIDGFITNHRQTALCLLFADCVPVFLYDPESRAIGLVHSGWKGTAANISLKAVEMMKENYGCRPENITAVIAPSICAGCYEVSTDLYEAFSAAFSAAELKAVFTPKENGKYFLDLWQANAIVLKKAGLDDENIHITDLCTSCNREFLFSHRALKGKRGSLAGVIMLR